MNNICKSIFSEHLLQDPGQTGCGRRRTRLRPSLMRGCRLPLPQPTVHLGQGIRENCSGEPDPLRSAGGGATLTDTGRDWDEDGEGDLGAAVDAAAAAATAAAATVRGAWQGEETVGQRAAGDEAATAAFEPSSASAVVFAPSAGIAQEKGLKDEEEEVTNSINLERTMHSKYMYN